MTSRKKGRGVRQSQNLPDVIKECPLSLASYNTLWQVNSKICERGRGFEVQVDGPGRSGCGACVVGWLAVGNISHHQPTQANTHSMASPPATHTPHCSFKSHAIGWIIWIPYGQRLTIQNLNYSGDLKNKHLNGIDIWKMNFQLLAYQMPSNSLLFKPWSG